MGNLFKDILGNIKTRIMFMIYLSIIGITMFFIIYGYFSQLAFYEDEELKRLQGIVSSLAVTMDGDAHNELLQSHLWMDDLTSVDADPNYQKIFTPLHKAQTINSLASTIYSMHYDDEEKIFLFIVSSDSSMRYRHKYEMYPDIMVDKLTEGAVIPRYEDENGEWISAFHPFFDSKGNIAGIIQADIEFGAFRKSAFDRYTNQALISLGVILLLALFLVPTVRGILKEDEQIKMELIQQHELIESRNKELNESLDYAGKIQEAMLPSSSVISDLLPDSFVFYQPKQVVSGDFYWFKELGKTIYVAVADCAGHGIPGALMSMIGYSKLGSIVGNSPKLETAAILDLMDKTITESLSDKTYKTGSTDGMEVGLCKVLLEEQTLHFSGAGLNLVKINGSTITEYKGNRFPIGGGDTFQKTAFDTEIIPIEKGDQFYLYSDGFPDQFGGAHEKKYLNKNFKSFLTTLEGKKADEKIAMLREELIVWQGKIEQIDDVLVIGLTF